MRPKNAIRAFALLAIFLASNIGCIGLVPAREFMEDVRDPPQLEEVIEKINVNHTFVSINFQPITFQERFVIDENVQELKVYIGVAFAGPDAVTVGAIRYVEASITDSNGERIWEERCEDTCRPSVSTFQQPLAMGTWTLSIQAQAHGEELLGNLQDTFDVYVHIHRECWQYPTESECTYD